MGACAVHLNTRAQALTLATAARCAVFNAAGQSPATGLAHLSTHVRELADQLAALADSCACGTDSSGRPELEISPTQSRAELHLRFVATHTGALQLQVDSGLAAGTELSASHARRIAALLISAAEVADAGSVRAGAELHAICEG